ncbi:GntR family transcriptional regulator [Estrella lausannensis]|uniref:Transcriptional regulator, gntR family n=1 Tax=Estrella lausannensis TaxID=483423 RepID=A0A0H5DS49_9BACT|nr:FCD domain-containing protein [Estrella lausannensis]CRX39551.1 Transcriptional regulator, gntR family [Estrella lausannensis]
MILSHQCFDTLLNLILTAELKPGEKLKVLPLSKKLRVGPTPVREALSRLAETGLVEATDNKGFRVSAISESDMLDLYATYIDLETLAITKAIERGDKNWEATIVAALYRLKEAEEGVLIDESNYLEWTELNRVFHEALVSGCGSKTLMEIRAFLFKKFERYWNVAFGGKVSKFQVNHTEHSGLADACLKRDKARAASMIRQHVETGLKRIMAELKEKKMI